MNNNFIEFITDLKITVLHVDDLDADFTEADNNLLLANIKSISQCVVDEIKRAFPGKMMTDEEKDSVVGLGKVLDRLRAEASLRLQVLQSFAQMTRGGAAVN